MKKRVKFKPRKVNLDAVRIGEKIVYAGDSLHTVPCPNTVSKGMRQNLRRSVRSKAMNLDRRKSAYNVLVEEKIATRRPTNKRRRKFSFSGTV